MGNAYRSAYEHIVGPRLAQARAVREELAPLLPQLGSIGERRIARAAAGAVGIAAAFVMVVTATFPDLELPTRMLLGGVLGGAVTYVLTRLLGRVGRRGARWSLPKLTGDLETDLARIESSNPLARIAQRLERLEVYSTALPLAAVSLLAPLTLHYLFVTVTGNVSTRDFDSWIRMSLVIVGHAHLALMGFSIAFARKMRRLDFHALRELPIHPEWAKALGIAILFAAVPGVILLAIPPILAAITGLVFVPATFALMRRAVLRERGVLLHAEAATTNVRVATDDAMTALEEATWSTPEEHPASLVAR